MSRVLSALRLGQVWRHYESALQRRPLRTQMCTTTLLWALGDVFSQRIEKAERWDYKRTAWTGLFGAGFIGPTGHYWYQVLERLVASRFTPGTARFIAAKVAADELMFGPLHVASFFSYMTIVQGGTWEDVKVKLRRDFWSAYLAELAVWPAFQTLNFSRVPVRHQLLMVNLGCLGDATFLCWVKNQDDWLAALRPAPRTAPEPEV